MKIDRVILCASILIGMSMGNELAEAGLFDWLPGTTGWWEKKQSSASRPSGGGIAVPAEEPNTERAPTSNADFDCSRIAGSGEDSTKVADAFNDLRFNFESLANRASGCSVPSNPVSSATSVGAGERSTFMDGSRESVVTNLSDSTVTAWDLRSSCEASRAALTACGYDLSKSFSDLLASGPSHPDDSDDEDSGGGLLNLTLADLLQRLRNPLRPEDFTTSVDMESKCSLLETKIDIMNRIRDTMIDGTRECISRVLSTGPLFNFVGAASGEPRRTQCQQAFALQSASQIDVLKEVRSRAGYVQACLGQLNPRLLLNSRYDANQGEGLHTELQNSSEIESMLKEAVFFPSDGLTAATDTPEGFDAWYATVNMFRSQVTPGSSSNSANIETCIGHMEHPITSTDASQDNHGLFFYDELKLKTWFRQNNGDVSATYLYANDMSTRRDFCLGLSNPYRYFLFKTASGQDTWNLMEATLFTLELVPMASAQAAAVPPPPAPPTPTPEIDDAPMTELTEEQIAALKEKELQSTSTTLEEDVEATGRLDPNVIQAICERAPPGVPLRTECPRTR